MAKGNIFLGYARGSIGDVVFSRVKGQQTSRARNRQPSNPRTAKQMTQRARFMAAVKFYARGQQNFFTFAFEDKRTNESDYNAFMRANAAKGIYFTKDNFDNDFYPSIGNWTLTRGSLNGIIGSTYDQENYYIKLNAPVPGTMPTTIGALATLLINNSAFMAGDIITLLDIEADAAAYRPFEPIRPGEEVPSWNVRQFALDVESTETLESYGLEAIGQKGYLTLKHRETTEVINGFAMVQSRNTAQGLKVSNSDLEMNLEAKTAHEYGTSDTWRDIVLADWKAREDAVLEGSLIP